MPTIPFVEPRFGGIGTPDIATAGPSRAFEQLGREAERADAILQALQDREAVAAGSKMLADFRLARTKRQLELQQTAKTPDGFGEIALKDFDDASQQLLDSTDNPLVQSFLDRRISDLRESEIGQAARWESETRLRRIDGDLGQAQNTYANLVFSDPRQFESALADANAAIDVAGLPLPMADARRASVRSALGRSMVYGLVEKDPWSTAKRLQDGEFDALLDDQARITAFNAAQSEVHRREAEARAQQAEQRAIAKAVEKERQDAEKKQIALVQALNLVGSGAPLDPRSTEDRKAVDLAWETKAETVPERERLAALVQFSGQVGMVPDAGKRLIRGMLRSSDDQSVLAGVEFVGRLKTVNPDLERDFAAQDLQVAQSVLAQTSGGVDAQTALRRHREGRQVDDPTRLARLAQFKKELDADPDGAAVALRSATGGEADWAALLGGEWVSNAAVPAEAAAHFNELRRDEYVRTGDLAAATRFAANSMKNVYGVSELTGGRAISKYAPEQLYGSPKLSVRENAEWIREQAKADAAKVLGEIPDGVVTLTPGRRVGPDGRRPAYIISITKPDGTIVTPERNGRPLLFVPDFKATTAQKRLDDEAAAPRDAARADKRDQVEGFKARGGTLPGDWGL